MIERTLLGFNILTLKAIMMWPPSGKTSTKYTLKNISFLLIMFFAVYACFNGILRFMFVDSDGYGPLVQRIIACIDFAGCMFMRYCFLQKIIEVNDLIQALYEFEEFCPNTVILEAENKVQYYSKAMIIYWFIGNVTNFTVPLLGRNKCSRQNELYEQRDPCGLMTQSFHPFDVSSKTVFPIIFFTQVYACLIITYYVVALTMTMVGIMIHTLAQLTYCRSLIRNLNFENEEESKNLAKEVRRIIRYHIKIIDHSEKTNEAFSNMMMVHITLTSLVISALGFEILVVGMVGSTYDVLRFALHLFGWLVIVLLACYYGQILINESVAISEDIYSISWYLAPVDIQKDIYMVLMRSQKALTLSAANLGVMSFPTFLRVISSAYSYFTLLLNVI